MDALDLKLLNNLRMTLAERLVQFRNALGWNQHDLAAAAGLSVDGVRGYEQQRRWPDPEVLQDLADALGREPAHLLGVAPKPTPEEALEVLREAISRPKPAAASLAQALAAALNESEFQDVALAIKNLTGGRIQLELPHKKNKAGN